MKNTLTRLASGFLVGVVACMTFIGMTEFANVVFKHDGTQRYDYSGMVVPGARATTAMSDYAENKLIDYVFRGQASGLPANWYIALYTDTCSDSAGGTEVSTSATGYGRQTVAHSLANWAGTQAAASTTASSGTSGTTSNNNAITWTPSTAAWGTIQSVGWVDTASGATNRWFCLNLNSTLAVSGAGFTVQFTAGQLQIFLDQ